MSLVAKNPWFHGFEPTIHTLELRVRDLQVTRGWWDADRHSDEVRRPDEIEYLIRGSATTGADVIAVIGSEDPADTTRTLRFALHGRTRERRIAEWEQLGPDGLADLVEDPTDAHQLNLVQFLRNVNENFDKEPPTILLQRQRKDRELDVEASWSIHCEVPPSVLEAIIADIYVGRCAELALSIELDPCLTESWYAPISEPATIGVLRQGKYDDGSCRGWVKGVGWATVGVLSSERRSLVDQVHAFESSVLEDEDETIIPTIPDLLSRSQTGAIAPEMAAVAIAGLARSAKVGFWLVFGLILLLALIR